jgi:hypothetical protein
MTHCAVATGRQERMNSGLSEQAVVSSLATFCCHNCCQRSQAQPLTSAENEAKTGQVGQESHLQPAVVEKAAARSSPSDSVSPVVRGLNLSPFSSEAV